MTKPWLEGVFTEPLDELKESLQALLADLEEAEVDKDTIEKLADIADHIDELFLLVIVGEVKAGKSSLINAIFHAKICPEGVTPTTDKINVLRWGERQFERHKSDFLVERFVPFDQLKNINIVDTPGTNSIIQQHTEISEGFIPRADLILFVTSIDRPYSKSEQDFLKLIADRWRKKLFFVLTKIDIKEPDEIGEVEAYVKDNCNADFGFEPLIFPCSPKQAYKAQDAGDKELLETSRLPAILEYMFDTLTDREKLELKLLSPITAAQRVCEDVQQEFTTRLEIITDHTRTLRTIEERVDARVNDLRQAYASHILDVSNLMSDVHNRGVNYLEDTIQLKHFRTLRDRDRFKLEFEKTVVQEFEKDLWDVLSRATDELVRKEMSLWQDTFSYYNEWVALERYKHQAIGKVSTDFEYNRDVIINSVRQDWQRNLNQFNYSEQCNRILDQANTGLFQAGLTVISSAGLGVIGVMIASAAALDATFIISGIMAASLGLLFIPAKRKKAVRFFRSRFSDLQSNLIRALEAHIDDEAGKIRDGILARLSPARDHFEILRQKTQDLAGRIDRHHRKLHEFIHRFRLLLAETYGTEEDVAALRATAPAGALPNKSASPGDGDAKSAKTAPEGKGKGEGDYEYVDDDEEESDDYEYEYEEGEGRGPAADDAPGAARVAATESTAKSAKPAPATDATAAQDNPGSSSGGGASPSESASS